MTKSNPELSQPATEHAAAPPIDRSIAPRRLLVYASFAVACVLVGMIVAGPVRSAARSAWNALSPQSTSQKQNATANSEGSSGGGVKLYQSGMHPWIITTEPGNCPICGMKLELIDPAKLAGEVTIDPVVVQNIGTRTAKVIRGPVTQTVRTVGTVEVAEPLVRDVNLRVSGWIESLSVDYVGAEVQVGDELFEVYSPQLYAAQEEFLLALRQDGDKALLASARDRLLNFGLTEAQVQAIADAGQTQRRIPILSPHTGVVLSKHANEGMNVTPGMRVFRIADLSEVWVQVTLYENQLSFIKVGQLARMTLTGLPGQTYEGQVVFVDPTVNPRTRAIHVRLAFDNPDRQLKPGMFANVTLQSTLDDEAVLVPRQAVIDTGQRTIAFVSLGQGRFEPRQVVTGVEAQAGMIQILEGLSPGEQVVTSGQFLLDSEASVRESLARMVSGNQASAATLPPPPTMASTTNRAALTPEAQEQLDHAARAYLAIQDALTRDTLEDVEPQLAQLVESAMHLGHLGPPAVQGLAEQVRSAAQVKVSNLKAMREALDPLSSTMIALLREAPPSDAVSDAVYVTHCPMVNKDWLQRTPTIRNPYATSMLNCGTIEQTITATATTTTHDHTGGHDAQ